MSEEIKQSIEEAEAAKIEKIKISLNKHQE